MAQQYSEVTISVTENFLRHIYLALKDSKSRFTEGTDHLDYCIKELESDKYRMGKS